MPLGSDQSIVAPLPDPALRLRRQMLVAGLFKYVSEIDELEDGYAFKFRRSGFLARRIADYILFESLNSPQLSFVLVVEPQARGLWLQIIGLGKWRKAQIRNECVPTWPSPLVVDR